MKNFASRKFWSCYNELPKEIRQLADKNFELLKSDPGYPSLHLKPIGDVWSVRVGKHYRALSLNKNDSVVLSWIGSHADYDRTVS